VSILHGKGTRMPSFRGRLSREQARELVAYIRQAGPFRAAQATELDDWDRRYAELVRQLRELQEEFRRLSAPPRKAAVKKPKGPSAPRPAGDP
jgi:hypothetical protein